MRQKKYERTSLILFTSLLLFFIEIIVVYNLLNIKIIEYKKYSIYLTNKNEGLVIVPIKDKMIWYKNTYIYHNNKKFKYQINEIKKTDKNYQILLNFPHKNKDKFITISIEKRRINILKSIINSWGGDNNN